MKVALVYDRVNKWGGAERVLLALHEMFPNAPLYTSVYNPQTAGWAETFTVKSSFLNKFPGAKTNHELYPLLMPLVFESFTFDEYDLVISVSSESAKGIVTKPHTLHLSICLTPTRYLWSGYDEYFSNKFIQILTWPFVWFLRKWDLMASTRPDIILSISQEVQKRVTKYYKRDSEILYPPVSLFEDKEGMKKETDEYYLVVSRLVPYKKIELAIKACNKLKRSLVIVGIGSELEKLQSIAGETVLFVGSLSDEELATYYTNCKALIFPGKEDFGITMVEANGFGRPVIAFKEGGAEDILQDGKTGVLFERQTVSCLVDAIELFESLSFTPATLKTNAKRFSRQQFFLSLQTILEKRYANVAK